MTRSRRLEAVAWPALAALVLMQASALSAQVNTERLRRDSLPPGLSASLDGAVSLHTGNVDFTLVELAGRVDLAGRSGTTFLVGRGDLGFQGGERFTRSGMLHLRRVRPLSTRLAAEAFGQVDHDRSRLLSFRGLLGGGARILVLGRQGVAVHTGIGYMFEHERLDLPADAVHPARTSNHRLTTYTTARLAVGSSGAASLTVYVQPRLDEIDDVRVLGDARLSAGLTDRMSLTMSFDLRYDSRPPDTVSRLDSTLRTGLGVTFGGR